jgi:hypothetical protein
LPPVWDWSVPALLSRLKLNRARSRSGAQVISGTRVGVPTGTGEAATITGRDLGPILIPIRAGDRDGVPVDRCRPPEPVDLAGPATRRLDPVAKDQVTTMVRTAELEGRNVFWCPTYQRQTGIRTFP